MKKIIITSLGIFLGLTLLQSCVKDEFDVPPNECFDEGLEANITIAELKNSYIGTIEDELIIEGIVIADDKSGNYFKEMVIQDQTGGIAILIDKNSFFVEYPIGRKVYVKLSGMKIEDNDGVLKLGVSDINNNQIRIPNVVIGNYIFKGPCNMEVEPQIVDINSLNPALINTLVRIENVEFLEANGNNTFADAINLQTVNRTLVDCNNNEIIVRTSGYADFASTLLPNGNGDLIAVYSVYRSDKQLFLRSFSDTDSLINTRCNGSSPNDTLTGTTRFHIDDILISDGSSTIIEQDFESTSGSGSISITGWTSFSEIGSVSWSLDNFSGNKYGRISGFNSGDNDIITWLVSPAFDMSATSNEVFSCSVQSSFDDGATLQVLYSTDYSGSGSPANATWTNLNATMPQGPASGFGTFQNVGPINMPSINSSTVYLAFRYLGGE